MQVFGKYLIRFFLVIQNFALVNFACSLYVTELKNVISLFVLSSKVLTSDNVRFLYLVLGSKLHTLQIRDIEIGPLFSKKGFLNINLA